MPGGVLCCPEDVRFEQPTAPAIIKLMDCCSTRVRFGVSNSFPSEICCAFTGHPARRRGYVAKQILRAKRRDHLRRRGITVRGGCSAPSPSGRVFDCR